MKLLVKRTTLKEDYTIGQLFVNGEYFCDTLEDKVRDYNKDGELNEPGEGKIFGKTAIPYGTYQIEMKRSTHFNEILPHLLNVHDFDGVLIHSGNTAEDTHGCILVGKNTVKGEITQSRICMKNLLAMLEAVNKKGEEITITIT